MVPRAPDVREHAGSVLVVEGVRRHLGIPRDVLERHRPAQAEQHDLRRALGVARDPRRVAQRRRHADVAASRHLMA
ncbi:MAG: hypothetical protein ACK559_40765, partial [bacterium]